MHTNVYEPFNVRAYGKYEYFIIFMDDYCMYGYIYLLHRKCDALDKFKEFEAKSENQLGKHLKVL